MNYDFIGDIHGYAKELISLLEKLGYTNTSGFYSHSERKVVFLGDFIDRGLEEEKVLTIVRSMIDNGSALTVMGNHEFNAICYATQLDNGEYVRKHTDGNYKQHKEFLDEYPFGSEKYKDIIEWFKTLPIFLEINGVRVIHAAWINEEIEYIRPLLGKNNTLTEKLIIDFSKKGKVYKNLEILLKGVELILPDNHVITDNFGTSRKTMRYNWYTTKDHITYRNCGLSIPEGSIVPDTEIDNAPEIYSDEIPVFFGHYWMKGKPSLQSPYVACLDYSVAKNGHLVAYRHNGEKKLSNDNFIY
jgi:calcineurin-like phosphoesterase family protein